MSKLITHHKKKREDLARQYTRGFKLMAKSHKHRHDERVRKLKLAGKVSGGFIVGGLMGFGMGSMATGTLTALGVAGTGGLVPTGMGTMSVVGARESYKQFTEKDKEHKDKVRAVVIGTPHWKEHQAKLKKR